MQLSPPFISLFLTLTFLISVQCPDELTKSQRLDMDQILNNVAIDNGNTFIGDTLIVFLRNLFHTFGIDRDYIEADIIDLNKPEYKYDSKKQFVPKNPGLMAFVGLKQLQNIFYGVLPRVFKSINSTPMKIKFKSGIVTMDGMQVNLPIDNINFIELHLAPIINGVKIKIKDLILHLKSKLIINVLLADIAGSMDVYMLVKTMTINVRFVNDKRSFYSKPRVEIWISNLTADEADLHTVLTIPGVNPALTSIIPTMLKGVILPMIVNHLNTKVQNDLTLQTNIMINKLYQDHIIIIPGRLALNTLLTDAIRIKEGYISIPLVGQFFKPVLNEYKISTNPLALNYVPDNVHDFQAVLTSHAIKVFLKEYFSQSKSTQFSKTILGNLIYGRVRPDLGKIHIIENKIVIEEMPVMLFCSKDRDDDCKSLNTVNAYLKLNSLDVNNGYISVSDTYFQIHYSNILSTIQTFTALDFQGLINSFLADLNLTIFKFKPVTIPSFIEIGMLTFSQHDDFVFLETKVDLNMFRMLI